MLLHTHDEHTLAPPYLSISLLLIRGSRRTPAPPLPHARHTRPHAAMIHNQTRPPRRAAEAPCLFERSSSPSPRARTHCTRRGRARVPRYTWTEATPSPSRDRAAAVSLLIVRPMPRIVVCVVICKGFLRRVDARYQPGRRAGRTCGAGKAGQGGEHTAVSEGNGHSAPPRPTQAGRPSPNERSPSALRDALLARLHRRRTPLQCFEM